MSTIVSFYSSTCYILPFFLTREKNVIFGRLSFIALRFAAFCCLAWGNITKRWRCAKRIFHNVQCAMLSDGGIDGNEATSRVVENILQKKISLSLSKRITCECKLIQSSHSGLDKHTRNEIVQSKRWNKIIWGKSFLFRNFIGGHRRPYGRATGKKLACKTFAYVLEWCMGIPVVVGYTHDCETRVKNEHSWVYKVPLFQKSCQNSSQEIFQLRSLPLILLHSAHFSSCEKPVSRVLAVREMRTAQ